MTHIFKGRHGDESGDILCKLLRVDRAKGGPPFLVEFGDGEKRWVSEGNLYRQPCLLKRALGHKPNIERGFDTPKG